LIDLTESITMIRRQDFTKLRLEVETAINEAFEYAKNNEKNENDYVLFLARSYYDKEIDKSRFSPWQIDRSLDEMIDRHRVEFLLQYLNQQYSFQTENSADSKFSLTLELMFYTHIWESFYNLHNYKRLADLCDSKEYSWNIEIGRQSKFIFIKDNIKNVFQTCNLKIYDLIDKSYHSQLRNAFAHSLYHFSLNGHNIVLENYDGVNTNIKQLSFDEWTERFLTSALMQNFYHNKFTSEIESLEDGKEYKVKMEFNGDSEIGIISYDKQGKRFNGRIK
jgi:hypothetical protein